MSNALTPASKAATAYRVAAFRARKRGQPEPDRGAFINAFLNRHGIAQSAAGAANDVPEEPNDVTPPDATPPSETHVTTVKHERYLVTPRPVPVRGRDPKTGRFPATPPRCPPCNAMQLEQAVVIMRQGELTRTVLNRSGVSCWESLNEGGLAAYGPETWAGIVKSWHDARVLRLVDRAQAVAERDEPAIEGEQTGPAGTVSNRQRRTDASMIQQALAGLLPNVHGKLASASATAAVQVNFPTLSEALAELDRKLEEANRRGRVIAGGSNES